MSNVNGVGSSQPLNRVTAPKAAEARPAAETSGTPRSADKVELSKVASPYLAKLKANDDVRLDKVKEIRGQIEAGTYETPDKIDGAVDKLLDDLLS